MDLRRVDLTDLYNEQVSVPTKGRKRAEADSGRSPYVR